MKPPNEVVKDFVREMTAEPVEFPPLVEINIIYESDMNCKLFIAFAGLVIIETAPKNLDHALDTAKEEIRKVLLQMSPSVKSDTNRASVATPLAMLRGDD